MRRVAIFVGFGASFAALLLFAACSSSNDAPNVVPDVVDAGTEADVAPPPTACDPTCKGLTIVATFHGDSLTFDRAQFGRQDSDGGIGYHVEASFGGSPFCPTDQSPAPDRSFLITGIPHVTTGQTVTQDDGVRGTFHEFSEAGSPLQRSDQITVTMTTIDSATPPKFVSLDVNAVFPTGTVIGHVYALYCDTLDTL